MDLLAGISSAPGLECSSVAYGGDCSWAVTKVQEVPWKWISHPCSSFWSCWMWSHKASLGALFPGWSVFASLPCKKIHTQRKEARRKWKAKRPAWPSALLGRGEPARPAAECVK